MAEEEVENLPPKEGAEGSKAASGGSPWVPLIVMVVLMVGLTYAINMFVILPGFKSALKKAVDPNSHEEVVESSHGGGGGHGGSGAGEGPSGQSYEFEDIVANLSGALHSRYVKVSFTVEGSSSNFAEQVEMNKAKLIDAALGTLSSLTIKDLEQPGVKNMIRNDLLSAFEVALNKELIQQLYFSEFVVQ